MKKDRYRIYIIISLFICMFAISFLDSPNKNTDVFGLQTSTSNYLFNGKEYDITLDDIYDDEDLSKVYTGANFQTVFLENDTTILSEAVSNVNNSEHTHPSNTDVSMTKGTFDNADNMKVDDDSNSVFTSPIGGKYPSIYFSYNSFEEEVGITDTDLVMCDAMSAGTSLSIIDSLDGHSTVQRFLRTASGWNNFHDVMAGQASGTIEFWTRVEVLGYVGFALLMGGDGGWQMNFYFHNDGQMWYSDGGTNRILQAYVINTWYHVRIDFEFGSGGYLGLGADKWQVTINDGDSTTGERTMLNPGTELHTMYFRSGHSAIYSFYLDAVGYTWDGYTPGDNLVSNAVEIDAGISSPDISEYENDGLLSLNVITSHYTNISTAVSMNLWNYDTTSWTNLGSSTKTSEFRNEYAITVNINDYFSPSGSVLFSYNTSYAGSHAIITDYIEFLLVYKMDLTHSITFETNGLWKYRWELIGSLQYTDWTFFEVVDPEPNLHAVSSSNVATRWILQEASLTPIEDFNDDINTDYWSIGDVSNIYFNYTADVDDDAYVFPDFPTQNTGTAHSIFVHQAGYDSIAYFNFPEADSNYLFDNQTGTTQLKLWMKQSVNTLDLIIGCYNTTIFDESTLIYNNAPSSIDLQSSREVSGVSSGWTNFSISPYISNYYLIKFLNPELNDGGQYEEYWSKEGEIAMSEDSSKIFRPYVNKNFFGSGYMYIQTDTTETISLSSQDYGSHSTLSSGDYFEVDLQTSSDSQIDLILLKDGVVNKTLTLIQSGNTNFGRQTVQIGVSEELEFDQLKISSTFEDTDNIKTYDIKTFKYTISGDYQDFYISPNNQRSVYLSPETYNLRVFEEGTKKIDTDIVITSSDYYYVYQPTATFQCRLTLHSVEGINLDITDFHILVNRSNGGSYSEFSLLGNTFYVDEGTMIYFEVSDRFDNLIDEFQQVASDYIDLELEVYSLKIKNLMEQQTTVDINGTQTFPVLSGELIEYILSKNYYEIGYYDMDNDYRQFLIYLDSNQAFELNRSKICFLSYADQQGNHLSFDNYKTYINDTMIYEQIFYEDAGDDVNITITDRYDFQVYSGVYSVLSGDNYIPITLTMYSLKVMNQQEIFNWINISRDPNYYDSPNYWSEWIAPNEIIEFKLFVGYYKINLTNNENSGSSFYAYTLSGDDILLLSSDNIISNVIYNIENVNTTIGNQITNVQIDLTNQNSDINNTIINIEINLDSVNSSLDTLLINQNTQLNFISNNISDIFIWIDTNFTSLQNNITTSFIDLSTDVYLINDTIYTAVIGVEASLNIINTTISGNLSLAIQQNAFLTSLLQLTLFSDLLNWTDASYNTTFIEDQIDVWTIINDFRNTSAIIELLYNNITDSLLLSAQSTIEQYLPAEGVEYRVWSVEDEKYLDDWQPLPDNMTIDFGFFEEIVPDIPDFYIDDMWLQIILIIVIFSCIIAFVIWIAVRFNKRNKSNKRKLYKQVSKGRDVEAEYYRGKETPF